VTLGGTPSRVPCAAAETMLKVSGSPSGSEAVSVTGRGVSSSVTTIWSGAMGGATRPPRSSIWSVRVSAAAVKV
jgi:hypothetical protein